MDKEAIITEIKATIKEAGLGILDIFGKEDIVSTDVYKLEKADAHAHAKRVEKTLGEEREKIINLTKMLDEKDTKLKSLNEVVSRTQVKTLFDKAKDVRKLDDKEKAFVEKRLSTFKSDKEGDDLARDFDKYVDTQLADYVETAKLLGVEIKPKDDKGAESSDGKSSEKVDLTDPKFNDLIPKD